MRFGDYFEYAKKFPIQVLVQKLLNSIYKVFITSAGSFNIQLERRSSKGNRFSWQKVVSKLPPHPSPITPSKLNTLGSSPSNLYYNEIQPGFEGIQYHHNLKIEEFDAKGNWLSQVVRDPHLEYSKTMWKLIQSINPTYSPIDWQKDIKTGFRWDAKRSFNKQGKLTKNHPGVDIKNPWEVSRLQHLPTLCSVSDDSKEDHRKNQLNAICQLLDFVMANPIGMGVCFSCPMDIGIRNANMLICINTLSQSRPAEFSPEIQSLLCNYVVASTTHVLQNLEYRTGLTSNHYLGNILGVLFAGSFLNGHQDADLWLLFSIQEIESCMNRQFFDDGGNFEGSTSYHRLSGEMMAWAAAISLTVLPERINRLKNINPKHWRHRPKIKKNTIDKIKSNTYIFSDSFWSKLFRSKYFTETITKNNGDIFQFGDNDSGRFIKLSHTGEFLTKSQACNKYQNLHPNFLSDDEHYWDENSLNHSAFIAALAGLMQQELPEKSQNAAEYTLFKSISVNTPGFKSYIDQTYSPIKTTEISGVIKTLPFYKEKCFNFDGQKVDFTKDTSFTYFDDFQLVVIKNKDFNLALAGISNPKQHHSLGHTHNDKLAIELQVNGEDILLNPGTYVYTPNPEARSQFRSVKSHNTASVNGMEQNRPLSGGLGVFNLRIETKFELLTLTNQEIVAEIRYRNIVHQRRIEIKPKSIVVQDWCSHNFEQHWNTGKPYSNGYGKRIA